MFDHHASYGEIVGSLSAISDVARDYGVRTCLCYEVFDRDGAEKTRQEVLAKCHEHAKGLAERVNVGRYDALNVNPDPASALRKKGILEVEPGAYKQGERCLECATICAASTSAPTGPMSRCIWVALPMSQIVHVDGMCSECGNCAAFCPYDSASYREKFTLFWSKEDFENSQNGGFLCLDGVKGLFRVRLDGQVADYVVAQPGCGLPEELRRLIATCYMEYLYLF